jgi:phospholipid-transporting ATPase
VLALRGGQFVDIKWKDIQVGDIVKIVDDSFIPADIIVLSSKLADGVSFIQTANLDGYGYIHILIICKVKQI